MSNVLTAVEAVSIKDIKESTNTLNIFVNYIIIYINPS